MIFNLLQTVVDTTALTEAVAPVQQEMKLSLIDMATKAVIEYSSEVLRASSM